MNFTVCSALFFSIRPPCGKHIRPGNCDVKVCSYAVRVLEAVHLIRLGARAGLVCQLTRLEKATVNRLYRQLCGTPSPSGQMPFTDAWYRENDLRMLHADIVWRLYRQLETTGRSESRVLIDVYEAYTRLVRNPLFDLTHTAFVPRLVTMETWQEGTCDFCGMSYLSPVDSNSTACPGCRLYYRHRCHHCLSTLAPQTKGRRRVVCGNCGSTYNGGTRQ